MMWKVFFSAIALLLVFEGIMPFLAPSRWRNMAALLAQIDDRSMRRMGLVSMLLGAGALYFING